MDDEWDNDVSTSDDEDTDLRQGASAVYQAGSDSTSEVVPIRDPTDYYDMITMQDELIVVGYGAKWLRSGSAVMRAYDRRSRRNDAVCLAVDIDVVAVPDTAALRPHVPAFRFYRDGRILAELHDATEASLLAAWERALHPVAEEPSGSGGGSWTRQGPVVVRTTTTTTTTSTRSKDPFGSFFKSLESDPLAQKLVRSVEKQVGVPPRASSSTSTSSTTSTTRVTSPRGVGPAPPVPERTHAPPQESPRAAPRRESPPAARAHAAPAAQAPPEYMRGVPRPSMLQDLPPLDRSAYTAIECDCLLGHLRWAMQRALRGAQTLRDHGLELSADDQRVLMTRVATAATDIKGVVAVLAKLDTRVASSLQRQENLLSTGTEFVRVTVAFVGLCQRIAKGSADVAAFESQFTEFVGAARGVLDALKFLHFDGQREFRLRY